MDAEEGLVAAEGEEGVVVAGGVVVGSGAEEVVAASEAAGGVSCSYSSCFVAFWPVCTLVTQAQGVGPRLFRSLLTDEEGTTCYRA